MLAPAGLAAAGSVRERHQAAAAAAAPAAGSRRSDATAQQRARGSQVYAMNRCEHGSAATCA
jgi:N-acetylmuramoyl-L-alanine amidase